MQNYFCLLVYYTVCGMIVFNYVIMYYFSNTIQYKCLCWENCGGREEKRCWNSTFTLADAACAHYSPSSARYFSMCLTSNVSVEHPTDFLTESWAIIESHGIPNRSVTFVYRNNFILHWNAATSGVKSNLDIECPTQCELQTACK